MKSVIISIKPEWCCKIFNGHKFDEIRKTRPAIDPPFKVYVYCSKGNLHMYNWVLCRQNGTICGEFICDKITKIERPFGGKEAESALTAKQMYEYAGSNETLWDWHIKGVTVYQSPKSLNQFGLKHAPQSWQYVDE